jgi:thiol-disulfide isomerase/thioredoxin
VLVDVWATWCKPCVAEIPALEKAQEEYAGKKIVFISVNTGDLEERWKNYVQKNHLGGVQLWEGKQPPNTGFKRDYLIKGIPRFMLIDPEGKFVEGNAPRPSYVEFRAMMSRIKDKL